MPRARTYTAADLATMPDDGQRYEIIDGELFVTPAPGGFHQVTVTDIVAVLLPYLDSHNLRRQLVTAPADLTLGADTIVEPDLFVADTAAFLRSGHWRDVTTIYLVIEVLSPSTARADRMLKRALYQRSGVPEYWIVDPAARQVEVWTPTAIAPAVHLDRFTWRHPLLDAAVDIDVKALFTFE